MKPIEIITETKTHVTYNGKDVNDILEEVCNAFHVILEECSHLKFKIEEGKKIEVDDFEEIECQCCELLDLLND